MAEILKLNKVNIFNKETANSIFNKVAARVLGVVDLEVYQVYFIVVANNIVYFRSFV